MITHISTTTGNETGYLTGVGGMAIIDVNGSPVLWTASQGGDGLRALSTTSGLTSLDQRILDGNAFSGGLPQIAILEQGGQRYGLVTGASDTGLSVFRVASDGRIGAKITVSASGGIPNEIARAELLVSDGKTYFFTLEKGQGLPAVYEVGGVENGSLSLSRLSSGAAGPANTVQAFDVAEIGGKIILFAGSTDDPPVSSYQLNANGGWTKVQSEAAADGPGVNDPTVLEFLQVGGETFAVVAAAATNSLTLYRVESDGSFTLTDHVLDSLNTRFETPSSLDVHEINGRVFAVAAGGDQGIALFEILPGGTILHLSSVEDTATIALTGVTAVTLYEAGGNLQILVAGDGYQGITQLEVATDQFTAPQIGTASSNTLNGTGGHDLLLGAGGDDFLDGGAGNDILVDGDGADRLKGGEGADIFVFGADGSKDTVLDFNADVDRLDLGHMPFLRNLDQLEITSTSYGARISFDGHVIDLNSPNGSLTAAQVKAAVILDTSRYLPVWLEGYDIEPDQPFIEPVLGTNGADALKGSQVDDEVFGMAGDDSLSGFGGDDLIYGNHGSDRIFGNAGHDRLFGDTGHDYIDGGHGDDTIEGGENDDTVNGGTGLDRITGGSGADQIWGGTDRDMLKGGVDDDTIYGGFGADDILGEDGNDRLYGQFGHDLIYGGNGHDFVDGGDRHDTVFGNSGDDTISGGRGFDQLEGQAGADDIFGDGGKDLVIGGTGNDLLDGGNGLDTLDGGDHNDLIKGGKDADWVDGGSGLDTISGGTGNDTIFGHDGDDILWGDNGHDEISGGNGADLIDGGQRNDLLWGNAGNDTLIGAGGADRLLGGHGHDLIRGGAGDDWLEGGGGNDSLVGGSGKDQFVFSGGHDTVTGFQNDIDDLLFSPALVGDEAKTDATLLNHITQTDAGLLFTFGNNSLLIESYEDTDDLADDIAFF